MIIENIQTAKIVDRAALIIEEITAVHDFVLRTEDPIKHSIAQLHFKTIVDRYVALVSGVKLDAQELAQRIRRRLDEIQLQRAEEMYNLRRAREIQQEELAMLGLIAA